MPYGRSYRYRRTYRPRYSARKPYKSYRIKKSYKKSYKKNYGYRVPTTVYTPYQWQRNTQLGMTYDPNLPMNKLKSRLQQAKAVYKFGKKAFPYVKKAAKYAPAALAAVRAFKNFITA